MPLKSLLESLKTPQPPRDDWKWWYPTGSRVLGDRWMGASVARTRSAV